MKRFVSFLLALCLLLLGGCQIQPPVATTAPDAHGTATVRRLSNYAIQNNIIYYVGPARDSLFAHDLRTGETTLVQDSFTISDYLYPDGDRLYFCTYSTSGDPSHVKCLSLSDPDNIETVFSVERGIGNACYDEGYFYYTSSAVLASEQRVVHSLYRTNIESKETSLVYYDMGYISSFAIDDQYIYVTKKYEGSTSSSLLRSRKDTLAFEDIPMPFAPYVVHSSEDGLFILPYKGSLIHYRNGVFKELPIKTNGPTWHVIGRKVIYLDATTWSQTQSTSCRALCTYDLDTKERTVINASVDEFDVLENRYIIYRWTDWDDYTYHLYDMQTGETRLIYEEKDSYYAP